MTSDETSENKKVHTRGSSIHTLEQAIVRAPHRLEVRRFKSGGVDPHFRGPAPGFLRHGARNVARCHHRAPLRQGNGQGAHAAAQVAHRLALMIEKSMHMPTYTCRGMQVSADDTKETCFQKHTELSCATLAYARSD